MDTKQGPKKTVTKSKKNTPKKATLPRLSSQERVLAIDPTTQGFGFAIFERPDRLLDWGATNVRVQKITRTLQRFDALIEWFGPTVIVLEDAFAEGSRRQASAKKLTTAIAKRAEAAGIPVRQYSRNDVQALFAQFGALTKEEIAYAIAEWLPVLADYRPPRRAIWESEDQRMNIFDASALALTFYYKQEDQPPAKLKPLK